MKLWKRSVKWGALLAVVMTLAACGGEKKGSLLEAEPVSEAERAAAENGNLINNTRAPDQGSGVQVIDGVTGQNVQTADLSEGQNLSNGEGLTSETEGGQTFEPVIYFGYDQYEIPESSLAIVKHYADLLMVDESLKLTLTGHTDERGTPEYNLALGERRAKAAQDAFMLFGVGQARIEVLTMGEEQPLVDDHTEAAYEKNRRVEIAIH